MSALLGSVLVGSLLGSLHCAGMCGGIVAVASSSTTAACPPSTWRAAGAYHLGRLVSYAALGGAAGGLGSALDVAGRHAGLQHAAALLAGLVMVVWALRTLLSYRSSSKNGLLSLGRTAKRHPAARWFGQVLRWALERPPEVRGALLGLATGLLPCGWLFGFVVIAAGSGSASFGLLVMAAFWLGTVPVLLGIGALVERVSQSWRARIPVLGAIALLGLGLANLWTRYGMMSVEPDAAGTDVPVSCPYH